MNIDKDAQNTHNANTTGGGNLSLKLTRSTDPKQAAKVAPPVQIFSTNQKGLSGMTTTVTNCGNRSIYRNGIAERERERDRPSGESSGSEKQHGVDQVRAAVKRARLGRTKGGRQAIECGGCDGVGGKEGRTLAMQSRAAEGGLVSFFFD
jgi:hypothetical protein